MSIHNLIEYSDDYSKRGILYHYCRDIPAVHTDGLVTDFT